MQTKTLLVTAVAAVLLWVGAGGAAVVPIAGFTSSQFTATINLRAATNYANYGGGPALDERYIAVYSDTEPLLANQSGYTGVDIYGGRVRTQFDTTNSMFGILNTGINTAGLNFRVRSNSNCVHQIASLFYVKKENFLNNGNSLPVNVTGGSAFTVAIGNEQLYGGDVRCVVRIGTQLYVSESAQILAYTGNSSNVYNFTGLDSSNWAPYDPSANIYFDTNSATFAALTLTNIQAAGFVINVARSGVETNHWKVYQFDISADVVPEPGLGLVVAGVAMLAMARRRG